MLVTKPRARSVPAAWLDRFRLRAIQKGEADGAWWLLGNLDKSEATTL
jgi:hypothetical protein